MSDLSNHIEAVKKFKLGAGQSAPDTKTEPTPAERITCIRLIIEEALELAEALGVTLEQDYDGGHLVTSANDFVYHALGETNFVEVADSCIDIMWVGVTGPMALCGISDKLIPALAEVDANNLLKLANGHKCEKTGKFIKPKDHPKVDLESIINQ